MTLRTEVPETDVDIRYTRLLSLTLRSSHTLTLVSYVAACFGSIRTFIAFQTPGSCGCAPTPSERAMIRLTLSVLSAAPSSIASKFSLSSCDSDERSEEQGSTEELEGRRNVWDFRRRTSISRKATVTSEASRKGGVVRKYRS